MAQQGPSTKVVEQNPTRALTGQDAAVMVAGPAADAAATAAPGASATVAGPGEVTTAADPDPAAMATELRTPTMAADFDRAVRDAIDSKTKPVGALGRLETLAVQIAHVQQTLEPTARRCKLTVFAGDLGMRLGEGTGALLAWPIVRAAAAMLRDMASFESAGVSERT